MTMMVIIIIVMIIQTILRTERTCCNAINSIQQYYLQLTVLFHNSIELCRRMWFRNWKASRTYYNVNLFRLRKSKIINRNSVRTNDVPD